MAHRTYNQVCSVAGALDLLGERWSLLLIRELLTGPQRFSDLLEGLSGIGTNLLSNRLKSLMGDGLVRRRRLPAPAASAVYELTRAGMALEPVILELVRWGLRYQRQPASAALYRPNWSLLAMRAVFRSERALGVRLCCEFRIDEFVFHAEVCDGSLKTENGPARRPDVVVLTDAETYRRFENGAGSGELKAGGRWEVQGSPQVLERFRNLFALPKPLD